MILGALISGFLHFGIIIVLLYGLPSLFQPQEFAPPIPVELVTIEELEIEDAPAPEPEAVTENEPPPDAPPPDAPPPDAPQQQALLTPPPEPLPVPEPDAEPDLIEIPEPQVEPEPLPEVPDTIEPEPVVEPDPVAEPEPIPEETAEPEPEPEITEPAPPIPRRKPKVEIAKAEPKKEEKPKDQPTQDRWTSILKNVEKLKDPPAQNTQNRTETQVAAKQPSRIQQDAMVRAIQQRLQSCWRLEPGAQNAETLAVRVTVLFNPDGTVREIKIVDSQRMASDSFFRTAAENARRAILECQPFNLPLQEYFVWQRVNLNFDPRRMFGG